MHQTVFYTLQKPWVFGGSFFFPRTDHLIPSKNDDLNDTLPPNHHFFLGGGRIEGVPIVPNSIRKCLVLALAVDTHFSFIDERFAIFITFFDHDELSYSMYIWSKFLLEYTSHTPRSYIM